MRPPKTKFNKEQTENIIRKEFLSVFGYECDSLSSHLTTYFFSSVVKPHNIIIQTNTSNLNLSEDKLSYLIRKIIKYKFVMMKNIDKIQNTN